MRVRNPSKLILATTTALLLVSGCSQKTEDSAVEPPGGQADIAPPPANQAATASHDQSGPDIGGAVAPGVAFTYQYAFTLPAKAISGVQRQHAAACERLGTARCRVTGMRYEQPGEDDVTAELNFLVAPDLAHRFGAEGIAAVEAADGKVDQASVNGEDAGSDIALSQQNSAANQAEVERLEARLTAKGLGKDERAELTSRVEGLRAQLRGEADVRRGTEAAIASTPVSFAYSSQGLLGAQGSFGKAAGASWGNVETMFSVMLLVLGYAFPWLLLAGLVVLALRLLKARRQIAVLTANEVAAAEG